MKIIIPFSFSIIFSLILSSAQILPTLELFNQSQRQSGVSSQEILLFKYPLSDLLMFFNPFIYGDPRIGTYPHFISRNGSLFWENSAYMGILPLILMIIGLFSGKSVKVKGIWITLMAISFLLMLGGGGPLYFLLMLPPFSFFRFSARFLMIFIFSIAILAGYGFDTVLAKVNKLKIIAGIALIFIGTADIFHIWINYHPTVPYSAFARTPDVVKDLVSPTARLFVYKSNDRLFREFTVKDNNKNPKYLELRNDLIPDSNIIYNLDSAGFYASLLPVRMLYYGSILGNQYLKDATGSASLSIRLQNMLNSRSVETILSPIPLTDDSLTLTGKYVYKTMENEYLYIYQNTSALPKYMAYREFQPVRTIDEILAKLSDPEFDIGETALVENSNLVSSTSGGISGVSIKPVAEEPQMTKLDVSTESQILLSVANTYMKGWKSRIDDKPARIIPVNLINQGVVVPPGKHTVTFIYDPDSFSIGIRITAVSYIIVIICYFLLLKRKKSLYAKNR